MRMRGILMGTRKLTAKIRPVRYLPKADIFFSPARFKRRKRTVVTVAMISCVKANFITLLLSANLPVYKIKEFPRFRI